MRRPLVLLALALGVLALVTFLWAPVSDDEAPSFEAQACGIPRSWLELTRRGYRAPRSGQIAILPQTPAYMATGGSGWSHSGPWPYLQRVPLVFYGPGVVTRGRVVDRPVTLADVAPTLVRLLRGSIRSEDGRVLPEVAGGSDRLTRKRPRLILVVVWDGGGWNALNQWPEAWPVLDRMISKGTSFPNASVGSSPSVTPSVHTTLGTGAFPRAHGITGIPIRDEAGVVVDAFLEGESSRFLRVPTLAELWDEQNGNQALVGMVGYEPWHLGMIGRGAELESGDRDDAAWLNTETNEWITNPEHYRLPPAIRATGGLQTDLRRLDAGDGEVDGAWGDHANFDEPDHLEESPAFIAYHYRVLANLIEKEGYGADDISDLLFTNFKQIDRLGHYFNMSSAEVHAAVEASDAVLGRLHELLDEEVGEGRWVLVVTADHGQQPDARAVGGYGIDPNELEGDIDAAFGPITRAAWPTEVFLEPGALRSRGVELEEVARFIAEYRLRDNVSRPDELVAGAGRFEPNDRLFALAVPARMLARLECPVTSAQEH